MDLEKLIPLIVIVGLIGLIIYRNTTATRTKRNNTKINNIVKENEKLHKRFLKKQHDILSREKGGALSFADTDGTSGSLSLTNNKDDKDGY